jgi:hypothetical protein
MATTGQLSLPLEPYGNFIEKPFCEKLLNKLNILHYSKKFNLSSSFSKKRSLNEIPIGSNGKPLLPCDGHLGYAIGTKITIW